MNGHQGFDAISLEYATNGINPKWQLEHVLLGIHYIKRSFATELCSNIQTSLTKYGLSKSVLAAVGVVLGT